MTRKPERSSSSPDADVSLEANQQEAARLILKGISVLLELAEHMKDDRLVAPLTLARDAALRQLAGEAASDPSAH